MRLSEETDCLKTLFEIILEDGVEIREEMTEKGGDLMRTARGVKGQEETLDFKTQAPTRVSACDRI